MMASFFDAPSVIDDIVSVIKRRRLDYDLPDDTHVVFIYTGTWGDLTMTMSSYASDSSLRLMAYIPFEPPEEKTPFIYLLLNRINAAFFVGHFAWCVEEKVLVWQSGILQDSVEAVTFEQIEQLIDVAVATMERFWPTFIRISWTDDTPEQALQFAIDTPLGRA